MRGLCGLLRGTFPELILSNLLYLTRYKKDEKRLLIPAGGKLHRETPQSPHHYSSVELAIPTLMRWIFVCGSSWRCRISPSTNFF